MGFLDAERAYGAVLRHAKRACCWWIPGALKCFKGAGEPHRTPALMAGFNAVPCASAARRPAGSLLAWNNFFGDIGFPDAERAYGAVLRDLPWPVLRHAKRKFFVRQHWLFDTPAPQPVAGRRHLPKRCFGSGCARPVATLKGAGEPHRTPALLVAPTCVGAASKIIVCLRESGVACHCGWLTSRFRRYFTANLFSRWKARVFWGGGCFSSFSDNRKRDGAYG